MKRALLVVLVLVVLLAAGLGLVLVLTGPHLVEGAIAWGGRAAGFQDLTATVSAASLRSLSIERLSAGPEPGFTLEGLELSFAPHTLREGRLEAVSVRSAVLHGVWSEQGVAFPSLPSSDGEEGPWLSPPAFARLELGEARVVLAGEAGPLTVTLSEARVEAHPDARLHARTRVLMERAAGALAGELDLVLDGNQLSGAVQAQSVDGALDLRLDLGAPGPAPGRFPDVAGPEALELAGRLELRAEQANLWPIAPTLTASALAGFELAQGLLKLHGEKIEAFGLSLAGVETEIALAEARARTVKVASLELRGVWNEDGIAFPALGAGADDRTEPAEAEGVEAEAEASGPVGLPFDRLEIARARVALGGAHGPVTVVLSDATLDAPPGARLHARTRFDVERAPGALSGEIDAVLDGPRLAGNASLRSQDGSFDLRLDLGAPGPAPGRFPDLAGLEALELAGRIEITAKEADLSPIVAKLTVQGALDVRLAGGRLHARGAGLSFTSSGVEVGGLGLTVDLSQLAPPAAPPGQIVSIETLRAGLDLGGGTLRLGLRPDGVLLIEPLDWRFHGGRLSSVARLDPSAERNELLVGVADVDLASLVAALGRADLQATGRVSGELPLRIEGDRIFADAGRLTASEEGGLIRYGTARAPGSAGQGLGLVLDALANFHYRRLEVSVDGELTGELELAIRLEGSNPDVYDGYPFQVNLNLDGPLADLVKGSTIGFRVQDAVEKRLQEREEKR